MMAKEPGERYQDLKEVIEVIQKKTNSAHGEVKGEKTVTSDKNPIVKFYLIAGIIGAVITFFFITSPMLLNFSECQLTIHMKKNF